MKKIFLGFVLTIILVSCATKEKVDKDAQITSGWSVERIYTEANDELTSRNYAHAIKLYDILISRYPYGKFAEQALLDKAYAYYKNEDKQLALDTIAEFQKLYPNHPRTDYVLYLKGLVEYDARDKSFLDKFSEQNMSERDPESAQKAYDAYQELVTRFPNSQYVPDATQKIKDLVDAFGGHEIAIARYYYKMGAFIAAANRASKVVNDYKNTPYVEEALAIMMSSYDRLSQQDLASDSKRLLELNYPESTYLAKNGWYDKNRKTPWQTTKHAVNKAGDLFKFNTNTDENEINENITE